MAIHTLPPGAGAGANSNFFSRFRMGIPLAVAIQTPLFNIRKITLPQFGQRTQAAIDSGDVVLPTARAAFVRECVAHYEPILPRPTEEQYMAITPALLAKYPCLKDRGTCYW